MRYRFVCLILGAVFVVPRGYAQPPKPQPRGTAQAPKSQPDVLILTDDEKLIGHFAGSNGNSLNFKSDALGALTIDWNKVKELHTGDQYVVIGKDVSMGRRAKFANAPTGKVDVTDKSLTVTATPGAAPITMPVADVSHIIAQTEFQQQVLHEPGLLGAWKGAVTAGATVVEATQQSRVFTGAISLVRAIPLESWMNSRNRTSINFSASDGFQLQPGTPKIKTAILHGDAERDEYFSASRVYGFAQVAFDHNYSQGLDLAQQYGGGLDWTVVKNSANVLDLKGSVSYMNQQFLVSSLDQRLIASTFSESYSRKFKRGMVFLQQLSVTPTWNNLVAWLAAGNSSLTVPVYKRLNFAISIMDNYLHDPPPGFKKNSFQATTGLTYTLR